MPALEPLRVWAENTVDTLPATHEAFARASAALFLLDWAPHANDVLLRVRPYAQDLPFIDDIDQLLTEWARGVS
jgi:hypothetical protein